MAEPGLDVAATRGWGRTIKCQLLERPPHIVEVGGKEGGLIEMIHSELSLKAGELKANGVP